MQGPICSSHMADLGKELKYYGLWHMVIQDGKRAADFARSWLAGTTQPEEFCPLTVAILEIRKKTTEMGIDSGCPLCELNIQQKNPIVATKAIKDVSKLMYLQSQVIKGAKVK